MGNAIYHGVCVTTTNVVGNGIIKKYLNIT